MLTVLLTGGRSSRMGRDKALLPVNGTPAYLLLAERYAALGEVALSADRPGHYPAEHCIELPDRYPGCGPLNGLYSAFTKTEADTVFLTATDLLFGDVSLVRELCSRLGGHEICAIRRENGRIETLFALYRRSCLPYVREALETGHNSMMYLYDRADVCFVPESGLPAWELDRTLRNFNTPEEFEQAFPGQNG